MVYGFLEIKARSFLIIVSNQLRLDVTIRNDRVPRYHIIREIRRLTTTSSQINSNNDDLTDIGLLKSIAQANDPFGFRFYSRRLNCSSLDYLLDSLFVFWNTHI